MKKNNRTYILPNIIKHASTGDTECANLLLQLAAEHLCDKSKNGEILQKYIKTCLQNIEHESFLRKEPNQQKTIFFNAFNLGKPNKRPLGEITLRNRSLTLDYITYILSGINPTSAIEEIQQKYFREKNRKSDGNTEYGSERTIRNIIQKHKYEVILTTTTADISMQQVILQNHTYLISLLHQIKECILYCDKKEMNNKYTSLHTNLLKLSNNLEKIIKNEYYSYKVINSLLDKILKQFKNYSPEFNKINVFLLYLKQQFSTSNIKSTKLNKESNKILTRLNKLFLNNK